jgi:hypothetical protein
MTEDDPTKPLAQLSAAVAGEQAKAHLVLAWRPKPPDYRAELVELEERVGQEFLKYARATAAQLAERTVVAYDPEWPLRDHEYFELAANEMPGGDLFTALTDFQNLNRFTRRQLTKPRLYVVCVQTDHGTACFGKRMAFLKVLKQKAGMFAAVWDGSTFNALTDSVATFSTSFDWVLWANKLYVLDAGGFHAEFRDSAALLKAVAEHVRAIGQTLPIQNADKLTERCRVSVPMASKLRRVAERGLHLTSTVDQLKQYGTQYEIPVVWDGDQLVFDGSLETQWAILKLLDEDRTEGPISHRHYESAAKREI